MINCLKFLIIPINLIPNNPSKRHCQVKFKHTLWTWLSIKYQLPTALWTLKEVIRTFYFGSCFQNIEPRNQSCIIKSFRYKKFHWAHLLILRTLSHLFKGYTRHITRSRRGHQWLQWQWGHTDCQIEEGSGAKGTYFYIMKLYSFHSAC